MADESSGSDSISKLRAWATPFATSVLLGMTGLFYNDTEKEAIEKYKVIAPFIGGAVSYLLGLVLSHFTDWRDKKRCQNLITELDKQWQATSDHDERVAIASRKKVFQEKINVIDLKDWIR